MSERIQKVLAQHGLGSRREVERWIVEGRIRVNGVVARTGDRYADGDRVLLDERDITRRLERTPAAQVIAYHKPQGQAIARDESRRVQAEEGEAGEAPRVTDTVSETAEERLPVQRGSRWVAINPMHPGDSGLLLFTNDGALSYALTRQKKKIPTTYMVRVYVRGGVAAAPVLPATLRLDEETIQFTEVTASSGGPEAENDSGNVWYKVVMPRADKRAAVRALFVSHSLSVSRMMQVAFGDIELTRDMSRARHVPLQPAQLESLYSLAQLKLPDNAPATITGMKRSRGFGVRNKQPVETNEAVVTAASGSRVPPPQRAALRRGVGGGSNRPSRPGVRPRTPSKSASRSTPESMRGPTRGSGSRSPAGPRGARRK